MKKFISVLLISVLCISIFSSCGAVKISETLITELKFLSADPVELEVGRTQKSYFTVDGPEDFTIDDLTFVSSDESVVTFTYDKTSLTSYVYYVITAVAPGTATVYVQTSDGVVKSEEITVTVKEKTTFASELDFEEETTEPETTEATTVDLSTMTIQERIEYAAQSAFEGKEVEVTYTEHTKYAFIKVDFQDLLFVKADTGSAQLGIYNTLKSIADINDLTISFSITFPSEDDFGNTSRVKVISAEYSSETRSKINWENFKFNKVDDIADDFDAHAQVAEYIS
ncbi:MAG: hypothetical protein IJE19_03460 [Clostridia bacterium]|nr:hypothetical protein [Clostridia bacterium]